MWFRRDSNVAFVTGDLVVADIDEKAAAEAVYQRLKPILKTCCETRRGRHLYFKAPCPGLPGRKLEHGDLRIHGGHVVTPESVVYDAKAKTRWTYHCLDGHPMVPVDELPVFTDEVLNMIETVPGVEQSIQRKRAITRGKVKNALAYAMKIESIQGQYGSNGLVRFFSVLRDSGEFTEATAMAAALEWQKTGRVVPEWSLEELARACSGTFAKKTPQ
jgi:hypothetical protein